MADASKKVNIGITTTADTAGADKAAKSIERIGAASSRASKEAEKQSKSTAYSIGNVGNQIQDVAVQIESGTSALRIFSQQAPQIAGAFGPYGAIGGALLALGALAFKTFSGMGQKGMEVSDQLEFMAEGIQGAIKIASDFDKQEIDFALKKIKASTDQANLLATAFDDSEKSAQDFTTKSLANFEKVRLALVQLAKLNGQQVDSVDEIKAAEDAASAARLNKAQQEIDAQNKRAEEARRAAENAQIELDKANQLAETQKQKIETADALLEKLRQERDLLKEKGDLQLKQDIGVAGLATILSPIAGGVAAYEGFQNKDVRDTNKATVTSQLALLDSQIADLEQSIGKGGAISNAVAEAAVKLDAAQIQARDIAQSAQTEIESIQQSFNAEEIKAKIAVAGEQSKAVSADITAAIESITPANAAQKTAIEGLKGVTSDNQILANETLATAAQLNALARALPSAETAKQATITALLNKVQQLQNDLNATNTQVNKLTQQKTVPLRTN